MPKLSRRAVLSVAAGGTAVAGLGAAGLLAATAPDQLARAILVRLVGPFRMEPTHLQAVVDAFEKSGDLPQGVRRGLVSLLQHAPGGPERLAGRRFEEMERGLLTTFVMSTDYLERKGDPDPLITFAGLPAACSSPFAVRGDA